MIINSPEIKKLVHEYDFTFESGMTIPVTIDEKAGDTISDTSQQIITIYLAPKPSKTNPHKILPAETIRIFRDKVLVIQDRERELTLLTPEQQALWDEDIAKMAEVRH